MTEPPQSSQARRVAKIKGVLNAVKENNWTSFNDFLLAFYTSNSPEISAQARRSIAYSENKSFPPEHILDAWLSSTTGETRKQLERVVTEKAAGIMVEESSRACKEASLQLSSSGVNVATLSTALALRQLAETFQRLLPCLWLLLTVLLTAANTYERKNHTSKKNKDDMATRICVVVISMLLHGRNRATDTFQLVMGVFLSSTGASRRVIDTFNHMGISVSYQTVQRCLVTLTKSATARARDFVLRATVLWAVVYDNINFTLRKASQRLDSMTEQLNATTSALFALPSKFTRSAYSAALSVAERNARAGHRALLTLDSLMITEEQQERLEAVFRHHVREILLTYAPGLRKRTRRTRPLRKKMRKLKPCVRELSCEKTSFFPLPALAQEEASVSGTIQVVTKLFKGLLGLAEEVIDAELRLLVGDWLSIRNLRLMKEEVSYELKSFARMAWVQEASMPFHFQLNAMYMLFRTHLGRSDDGDPASLERHRTLLRRAKLDPQKPEYNKARQLVEHSLIARIIDCTRVILKLKSADELKSWKPDWTEFDAVVCQIVDEFTSSSAAQHALDTQDEVLAHAILFNRDALLFREFGDAVRHADVGRMWLVYDFWVFMMRGAGCHNYGNEILEMKAQFQHVLPELLREVVENTWLVNRWGKRGRSIPTDLYLEHNNGFLKNMFAALGSNASMDYIQTKSSACIEVLRDVAHDVAEFFGLNDFHRGHGEVDIKGDLQALLVDLAEEQVHSFVSQRRVKPPPSKGRASKRKTGVRDVLREGMHMLTYKGLYRDWLERTGKGGTGLYEGDEEGNDGDTGELGGDVNTGTAFDDPNGTLELDLNIDSADMCPSAEPPVAEE